MKLIIKTLQQTTFTVEIEPDKTVKELKDKIEADHGKIYPTSAQKLIYSGKILVDENKLSEYEIDEKKFVVLMITRPPPAPKPPAAEKQAPSKKDDPASAVKSKSSSEDKSKSSTTQSSTATTTTSSSSSSTSSVTAPAASTATSTTTTTTPNTTTTQQSAAGNRPTGRSSSAAMDSRLANMMAQPQFRQIQDLIQQSPHLLSSTIEALAGSDPEMHRFISENPDVFVNALNQPLLAGSRTQSSRSSTTTTTTTSAQQSRQNSQQQQQQQASGGTRNSGSRQLPVVDQFLGGVSEHDKQAIERLKELGFSEYLAVQAYMACDKDEQLAANLLFQMDQ